MTFEEVYALLKGQGSGGDVTKVYVDEQDAAVSAGAAASAAASGESITLTDAADAKLQELEIYGKTELFQDSLISVGENGLTVTCGSTSAALSSGLPLRGVPVTAGRTHNYTDGNGQDWTVDIYDSSGKKTACTALIDLGDLTWTRANGTSGVRYFTATPAKAIKQIAGTQNQIVFDLLITDGYSSDTGRNVYYGASDKIISFAGGNIAVYNADYVSAGADDFKAAVTGVKLLYELETPENSDISVSDCAALRTLRTEPGNIAVTNGENAFMQLNYLKNTVNGNALAAVQDDIQRQIDAL